MKRVKYFDEERPGKLENEINEFLSESNVNLIDVKFQSEKSNDSYGGEILFSALVIYEEQSKGQ